MFERFNAVEFKIVSVSHGSPTSVENKPQLPFQDIRLGLPCQIWSNASGESRLCGYPYVGLRGDQVIASVERDDNLKWVIERVSFAGAYIVRLRDNPERVWTVSPEDSPNPHIVLMPFRGRPDQFFRLDKADA